MAVVAINSPFSTAVLNGSENGKEQFHLFPLETGMTRHNYKPFPEFSTRLSNCAVRILEVALPLRIAHCLLPVYQFLCNWFSALFEQGKQINNAYFPAGMERHGIEQ